MKTPLAALAICTALLALPATTSADVAMHGMKPVPMDATMLCRAALPHEKPTAMMGTKGIVCKSMAGMMKGGMMMVPDTKSAADKAWDHWLEQSLLVPRAGDV